MPETATNPAPPPPPIAAGDLSPESYEGLVNIVQSLAALADMLQEGMRVPFEPKLDAPLKVTGSLLVRVDKSLGDLSTESLMAWTARASQLALAATTMVVNALVELDHRAQAQPVIVAPDGSPASVGLVGLVGLDGRPLVAVPRPRRADEIAQLPDHLLARVRPAAPPSAVPFAGIHTFSITEVNGRHRVVCHTCDLALGEVDKLETAETIAETHSRGGAAAGERVAWMHPNVPQPGPGPYEVPTCRSCWCTDGSPCRRPNGTTCSWADLNPETNAGLCTACKE